MLPVWGRAQPAPLTNVAFREAWPDKQRMARPEAFRPDTATRIWEIKPQIDTTSYGQCSDEKEAVPIRYVFGNHAVGKGANASQRRNRDIFGSRNVVYAHEPRLHTGSCRDCSRWATRRRRGRTSFRVRGDFKPRAG